MFRAPGGMGGCEPAPTQRTEECCDAASPDVWRSAVGSRAAGGNQIQESRAQASSTGTAKYADGSEDAARNWEVFEASMNVDMTGQHLHTIAPFCSTTCSEDFKRMTRCAAKETCYFGSRRFAAASDITADLLTQEHDETTTCMNERCCVG